MQRHQRRPQRAPVEGDPTRPFMFPNHSMIRASSWVVSAPRPHPPPRACFWERVVPEDSEQIRRSTERFRTLGTAPRTHCVSAVNSRSVSCFSAVFGPILELTQEIGPF